MKKYEAMIADRYVFCFCSISLSFISIHLLTHLQFTETDLSLSRASITFVQTGSTAEDTGPKTILLKGGKKAPIHRQIPREAWICNRVYHRHGPKCIHEGRILGPCIEISREGL